MKFFYSAAVMGYGGGRWWHRKYNFPKLSRVTKSLTILPKIGFPFAVVVVGNSVWNRVSLHNVGFFEWLDKYSDHEDFGKIIVGKNTPHHKHGIWQTKGQMHQHDTDKSFRQTQPDKPKLQPHGNTQRRHDDRKRQYH